MKLLITGAFGNIGKAVIEEAPKYEITVFEVSNKKTGKTAKNTAKRHRNLWRHSKPR